jgi:hypothetical protein
LLSAIICQEQDLKENGLKISLYLLLFLKIHSREGGNWRKHFVTIKMSKALENNLMTLEAASDGFV